MYKNDNNKKILFLALTSLGVVYGDIGTSSLYAIKECFNGIHAISLNELNVLGILSLAFWSLTIIISLKYITFVTKADNHGEGGMFALLALIPISKAKLGNLKSRFIIFCGLLGASLLYGDGVITPTISVLSAIEGLEIATETAKDFTVILTCLILFTLFYFQKQGTTKIGKVFSPIMFLWFSTLFIIGLINLINNPLVLNAINPYYAILFFINNTFSGFIILGSVVLCITGGEALYADMGHFGRKPIKLSWFSFVYPSLILNYFGQGALILKDSSTVNNPFYNMVPKSFVIPMVILSTMATIIASQALISGIFSITRQAIQLGYLPRLNIVHTSEETEGQIYIPFVNKLMMIACILVVLTFKESSKLAAAYGMAVTTDMVLTSILFFFVLYKTWKWNIYKSILLVSFFLIFDLSYFLANILKFFDGGWFPLTIALTILFIMQTWREGREILGKRIKALKLHSIPTTNLSALSTQIKGTGPLTESLVNNESIGLPIEELVKQLTYNIVTRVYGNAVFMTVSLKGIPPVLLHHIKHNQVLHERVILMSIKSVDIPYVKENRLEIRDIGCGFYQLIALYGFMETPNVIDILKSANELGFNIDIEETTFYLGRESIIDTGKIKLSKIKKELFIFMSRNAQSATAYFSIPPSRVVEIGMQIEI
ncbi:MAG: putative potassium transport system protein kup 1 [Candidatus Sericytochromatia bacterium]|nr:MAG: putative potassium transport system protein kup 1 [Candidatus Sericytochromatia bacterium]